MADLSDILSQAGVVGSLKATSKKHLLQELASRAAPLTGLAERVIFETLLERERLGSTGFGHGIATPHGKFAGLDRIIGVFARLEQKIDFDSIDDQPVDLVFLLMAPEGAGADHLKALSRVSRLLRNMQVCEKLRGADDSAALYAILTEPLASNHQAA
jgi:PTS system nitrogen regulatory IIA component